MQSVLQMQKSFEVYVLQLGLVGMCYLPLIVVVILDILELIVPWNVLEVFRMYAMVTAYLLVNSFYFSLLYWICQINGASPECICNAGFFGHACETSS